MRVENEKNKMGSTNILHNFFNDTATTEIYTLSLHDALPILSLDLVKMALGQFDLGPAAAMSLIYFLIVLLICWVFYSLMMKDEGRT